MTTRNFKAAAHRSQGWWAFEVTGDDLPHPAYTQARRLDQAEDMVRDLLALHFGIGTDEVGHIEVVPVLDAALADEVTQTRQAREQGGKGPGPGHNADTADGSASQGARSGSARYQYSARPLASSCEPAARELKGPPVNCWSRTRENAYQQDFMIRRTASGDSFPRSERTLVPLTDAMRLSGIRGERRSPQV